ncbi:hypothetical protein GW17_00012510, partial [Ensete ventricosum]
MREIWSPARLSFDLLSSKLKNGVGKIAAPLLFTPPLLRFTQKKRTTDEPPPAPPMAPSSSSLSHAKRGRAVAVAAASSSAVLLSFFLLLVVLVPQHALNSPISLSSDLSVRPSPPLPPPKAVTLTQVAAEKPVSEAEAPGGRDLSMPPSPSPWPPPGTLVAAVLAQEPAAAPPPERRERRCDLHQGRWERDEEGLYPLYHPGSCPYVDEAFSCQENGRRDLGYLRWRWKPHGCDLPRGGDWDSGGTCNGETDPIKTGAFLESYPSKMKIVDEVINRLHVPVVLLNVTKLTNYRKDGHPSIYGKKLAEGEKVSKRRQDCSHWCLPGIPDSWNELIYASLVLKQPHPQSL